MQIAAPRRLSLPALLFLPGMIATKQVSQRDLHAEERMRSAASVGVPARPAYVSRWKYGFPSGGQNVRQRQSRS
jgi:hypothetical protein